MKTLKTDHIKLLTATVLFSLILSAPSSAQKAKFNITIENIMRGPELIGSYPSDIRWSANGDKLYFKWKKPGEKEETLYFVTSRGGKPKKATEKELDLIPPINAVWDKKRERALFADDGDIYLIDFTKEKKIQLTRTPEKERNPGFTCDEKKVFFTLKDNLFILSLGGGELVQATNFKRDAPPRKPEPSPGQKFLLKQQRELFEQFKKKDKKPKKEKKTAPPVFLKKDQQLRGITLSPDGRFAFFTIVEHPATAKTTIVPNYVTRDGYTSDIPSRTKAGDYSYKSKAGIIEAKTGKVTWFTTDVEKELYFYSPKFSPDEKKIFVQAYTIDGKDRYILLVDPATAKGKIIFHQDDPAWIGGYGSRTAGWMPNSEEIYFLSDGDGYSQLYTVSINGGEPKRLTGGKFVVIDARLSEDGKNFYLVTNESHPGNRQFYIMPAGGGKRTLITTESGFNIPYVSPDGKKVAVLYSRSNQPPELYLMKNKPGAKMARITISTTPDFQSYDWAAPKVLSYPAQDGKEVYARIFVPEKKNGAAVVFIHGAGYLQEAHNGWSHYYREYMFHNFLLTRGYIVLEPDYRGSAGYGRDWRCGIYRHMGGKDLDDVVAGAEFLVKEYGVDKDRIGIYGGSYGGFITLMAMFTKPQVFACGASLRPVTDWAHYSNWYTDNILNLPQDDPDAYKRSSPIYFAEGLKNPLLICHGMVDTNVHFQDTARLVQRLIELEKENWWLAIYPMENHGFRQATSWTDEYRRIYWLFKTYLEKTR
jgi:dipeptidyl aminopeptidase/acylaminoacyl peptidase